MRTDIIIPKWLDKIIYEDFGVMYEPNPQQVVYNPDKPYEFVKCYLGTYFPRSYAEAICITDRLFENPKYYEQVQSVESINILDVCCGTGGEIVGLILQLQERLPNLKYVYIDAVDANVDAIRFLYHLFEKLKESSEMRIDISIDTKCLYFENEQYFQDLVNMLNVKYHYILSFKAVNEFVQSNIFPDENEYQKISSYFLPLLLDNGCFILSDITTLLRTKESYYPQLMNTGLNQIVRSGNYKSVIPNPCYHFEQKCNGCYMQDIFTISHSRKSRDISKVAYRVVCKSAFADRIMEGCDFGNCRYANPFSDKNTPYLT